MGLTSPLQGSFYCELHNLARPRLFYTALSGLRSSKLKMYCGKDVLGMNALRRPTHSEYFKRQTWNALVKDQRP